VTTAITVTPTFSHSSMSGGAAVCVLHYPASIPLLLLGSQCSALPILSSSAAVDMAARLSTRTCPVLHPSEASSLGVITRQYVRSSRDAENRRCEAIASSSVTGIKSCQANVPTNFVVSPLRILAPYLSLENSCSPCPSSIRRFPRTVITELYKDKQASQ
jgi:hypothetical protein